MILKSGAYRIEDRALNLDLATDLEFSRRFNCYTFTGDNGCGKTSFIEHVIIPALMQHNIEYLYLGQDIRNQLYTIKALLSVRGYTVANADESTLLRWWLELGRSASVLILDEFDKYFPDVEQIFTLCDSFIRTYVAVTHIGSERIHPDPEKYRTGRRRFELVGYDGQTKNILIGNEIQ